jgi:alkaline phosphatase
MGNFPELSGECVAWDRVLIGGICQIILYAAGVATWPVLSSTPGLFRGGANGYDHRRFDECEETASASMLNEFSFTSALQRVDTMQRLRILGGLIVAVVAWGAAPVAWAQSDFLRDFQTNSIKSLVSADGHGIHWGPISQIYTAWGNHTNRLIPVYTFGTKGAGSRVDLTDYSGENSVYRSAAELERIYGRVPSNTLNREADYFDQTDLARLQRAGFAAGKKHVFLVIFDGMDWQTTWAAAIYNRKEVAYRSGRGLGTHFQEYTAGGTTQFGCMVTSPHCSELETNVDLQAVGKPKKEQFGGYNARKLGPNPWTPGDDWFYPIGKANDDPLKLGEHAFSDSAATATAMTTGVKTANDAINVDPRGKQLKTIAHEVQEQGLAIGVVTSVPISHATPACAYAHNVHRDDYQDLTRDLLGLPSISHPEKPLPGVDVLIGGGYRDEMEIDTKKTQGANFVPGNKWISVKDLNTIDAENGGNGNYVIAMRKDGANGAKQLATKARRAADKGQRLFGFYGAVRGHLPFQTADGQYNPTFGNLLKAEEYTAADLNENPTLADMTAAALTVLEKNPKGFWLMVESGDVDWANHENNIDNSIGAVNSGDVAVKKITDWVEKHSNWNESLLIVTADHGHYLVIEKPELLIGKAPAAK